MTGYVCAWVDPAEASECFTPATSCERNIPLCDDHRAIDERRRAKARITGARQGFKLKSVEAVTLEDYPGICYVILLPDTTVKIGFSFAPVLFDRRMVDLSREHGTVIPLTKLPGGWVTESLLHDVFAEERLPGEERFRYSERIAQFVADANAGLDLRHWFVATKQAS